jgi:hypothetical protein
MSLYNLEYQVVISKPDALYKTFKSAYRSAQTVATRAV